MNGNSTRTLKIETGGSQVVGHVGLHALGHFADRIGFGDSLSKQIPWGGERMPTHDRGKVLVHAMLMLAGGGEACSDIEHLRGLDSLFGSVASAPTLYRTHTNDLKPAVVAGLWDSIADVRERMWDRAGLTSGTDIVKLDIDATLVEIHSENKEQTAPTYKGGFGFSPMFIFADATGETLGARLRPGNAGANTVVDHVELLDQAITGLPARIAAGHQFGDDADTATRRVQVRADSAGCTTGFIKACRQRNVEFAVVARRNASIEGAIRRISVDDKRWQPALTQTSDIRKGAAVIEITNDVKLTSWPTGTRLIVRREPKHPGAQRSLFPSDRFRYWGHYTDTTGTAVECDLNMRAHAHVEDHIARLKDSGLERMPFTNFDANSAWCAVVCWSDILVRWFQQLVCTGHLARANPRRMRWQLWHTPARLIRTARRDVIRLLDTWPGTKTLLDAYTRINAIT